MNQIPSPGRIKEVMGKVYTINQILSTDHKIDSPMYEAAKLKQARQSIKDNNIVSKYSIEEKIEEYWKRGRISNIGISEITINPKGEAMPSPYLRNFDCGNLLEDGWSTVYEGMADFNEKINYQEFVKPQKGFDLRKRTIASDLDITLNNSYKKQNQIHS